MLESFQHFRQEGGGRHGGLLVGSEVVGDVVGLVQGFDVVGGTDGEVVGSEIV